MSIESACNAFNGSLDDKADLGLWEISYLLLMLSPAWLPVGFVGYAIAKKGVNPRMLLALAAVETVALCANVAKKWLYGW
jgi:hypothetical protein